MDIMKLDDSVYSVCRDWYDSETLPLMTLVAYRYSHPPRDIPLRRLLAELDKCARENTFEKEESKIAAAVAWCRRVIERDAVLKAAAALAKRARQAGLEEYEVEKAIRNAWGASGA